MTRSALLLSAVALTVACFACAQGQAPLVALPLGQSAAGPICRVDDPQSFVDAVQLLPASYNPNGNQRPVGSRYGWPKAVSDDLKNAFSKAPPFFRQHLCGLDGIYISCPTNNPNVCDFTGTAGFFAGAWGFRSRGHDDPGKTYIALSAGLWPSAHSAPTLSDYETQVLISFPGSAGSKVYIATPNDSWMTVLAALAHEVGHVRWTLTTRQTPGSRYDFRSLIQCPRGDFFADWTYNRNNPDHPHLQPRRGWRNFGDRSNEAPPNEPVLDHVNPPTFAALNLTPADSLYQLYQAYQPWPSLFGAQTPDEDFVETYVMAVLTGYAYVPNGPPSFSGPLTSLALQIPGYTGPTISNKWADVPRDLRAFNKPVLANKMSCISY
jgi:hypothetical protein